MRILSNPFFLLPCLLFWVNQYLEKVAGIFVPYVHSYLDDLLAMPVILGITLQIFQWINPVGTNYRFSPLQIMVGVAYVSLIFEVLLPYWSDSYVGDLWDVFCYSVGAVYFYRFINPNSASS